jgi:hypothetical protein
MTAFVSGVSKELALLSPEIVAVKMKRMVKFQASRKIIGKNFMS